MGRAAPLETSQSTSAPAMLTRRIRSDGEETPVTAMGGRDSVSATTLLVPAMCRTSEVYLAT